MGLARGTVVGQGESYESALSDVRSALAFHAETFGPDALSAAVELGRSAGYLANRRAPGTIRHMNTILEIERAVEQLPPRDLAAFRAWFTRFDSDAWDREIDADADAGRLDALAAEALADLRGGRCTEL